MPKTKPPVEQYRKELVELTSHLLELSMVDDQSLAVRREVGGGRVALEASYWSSEESSPDLFGNVPYAELYARFLEQRAYDLRFLDGGLVQARFEFASDRAGELLRSRLAYLPSPDLTPFQDDPEVYLHDELFGDVVDVRAVTVPFRFDYDGREDVVVDLHHPVSHATLGHYPHCRVAVSGPITPYYFVEFLLRSFYRTQGWLATDGLPGPRVKIQSTITDLERSLLHFGLPTHVNA